MAKTRTFIAIGATPEIKQKASELAKRLDPFADGFRWVATDGMHYTLQFLGDLSDQDVADVCLRVSRVADEFEPFTLQARGAGAFPSLDRPRTLWLGAGEGAEHLKALQAGVEAGLEDLGFRGENRRFVPHLTIGKASRTAGPTAALTDALQELTDYDAGAMPVTQVTVYASELLPDGPEYHVLATCPLAG